MLDVGAESLVVVDELFSDSLDELTGPVVDSVFGGISDDLTVLVLVTSTVPLPGVVIVKVPDDIVTVTCCVISTAVSTYK